MRKGSEAEERRERERKKKPLRVATTFCLHTPEGCARTLLGPKGKLNKRTFKYQYFTENAKNLKIKILN